MLQEQDVLIESAVILLPHQTRALSSAIASNRVRYILTDEVGPGNSLKSFYPLIANINSAFIKKALIIVATVVIICL